AARGQFYQFGIGLAFLATVRTDGAPRVHPVCPVISDAGLHVLIVAGPKRQDLRRDGRYARSEEHTSELQSLRDLVCRLLIEKKILSRPPICSGTKRGNHSATDSNGYSCSCDSFALLGDTTFISAAR